MTELRVENSRDRARLVAGLAAAPVIAALVAYFGFPIVHWSGQPLYGRGQYSSDAPVAFATGVAFAGVFVVLVAAAPALLWLLRRGPVTLEQTLLAGIVIGNLPYVLQWVWIAVWSAVTGNVSPIREGSGLAGAIRGVLIGSILGVLSAAGFWVVAAAGRRSS